MEKAMFIQQLGIALIAIEVTTFQYSEVLSEGLDGEMVLDTEAFGATFEKEGSEYFLWWKEDHWNITYYEDLWDNDFLVAEYSSSDLGRLLLWKFGE